MVVLLSQTSDVNIGCIVESDRRGGRSSDAFLRYTSMLLEPEATKEKPLCVRCAGGRILLPPVAAQGVPLDPGQRPLQTSGRSAGQPQQPQYVAIPAAGPQTVVVPPGFHLHRADVHLGRFPPYVNTEASLRI